MPWHRMQSMGSSCGRNESAHMFEARHVFKHLSQLKLQGSTSFISNNPVFHHRILLIVPPLEDVIPGTERLSF